MTLIWVQLAYIFRNEKAIPFIHAIPPPPPPIFWIGTGPRLLQLSRSILPCFPENWIAILQDKFVWGGGGVVSGSRRNRRLDNMQIAFKS